MYLQHMSLQKISVFTIEGVSTPLFEIGIAALFWNWNTKSERLKELLHLLVF